MVVGLYELKAWKGYGWSSAVYWEGCMRGQGTSRRTDIDISQIDQRIDAGPPRFAWILDVRRQVVD